MSSRKKDGRANALIESRSPYLLQHAYNPVDWMEWGDDVFRRSADEDKPIFLSVGYSTCHWCHVMARESFENDEIAALLNEHFVSVKVDREERPDVDRLYMTFVQSLTGSGGWPMSVWMTSDGKPFYGGTYFPPDDRYGRIGFPKLLERIHELWMTKRGDLREQADKFVSSLESLSSRVQSTAGEERGIDSAVGQALDELSRTFDREWGGFGSAPKFPTAPNLRLLLELGADEQFERSKSARAKEMLSLTLRKMADGGIWDFVGGGFHRYSVDRYWHVPHYEKMLYDQGQLLEVYAEASRRYPEMDYSRVLRETMEYLRRDMRSAEGGLFAAEDADSEPEDRPGEHAEGAFYVWTEAQLEAMLGPERFPVFREAFGIMNSGNSPEGADPHGELVGKNTLRRLKSDQELTEQFGRSAEEIEMLLEESKGILFEAREKRPRPHLDDKIVAAWLGMAISGLCKAYQVSGDEQYLELGREAAEFGFSELYDAEEKRLYRVYREGRGEVGGFAEDYASLALALVDLHESSGELKWLKRSDRLAEQLIDRFEDAGQGGFFATESGSERLIARLKDDYDGAEPCASSLAVLALRKLGRILGEDSYLKCADRAVNAFAYQWTRVPRAMPLMLVGALRGRASGQEIVIAGEAEDSAVSALRETANRYRSSGSVVIVLVGDANANEWLLERNPALRDKLSKGDGGARAYVCHNYACQAPVSSPEALKKALM